MPFWNSGVKTKEHFSFLIIFAELSHAELKSFVKTAWLEFLRACRLYLTSQHFKYGNILIEMFKSFTLDKLQSQAANGGQRHRRQTVNFIMFVEFVETSTSKKSTKTRNIKPSLHMEYLRFRLSSRELEWSGCSTER